MRRIALTLAMVVGLSGVAEAEMQENIPDFRIEVVATPEGMLFALDWNNKLIEQRRERWMAQMEYRRLEHERVVNQQQYETTANTHRYMSLTARLSDVYANAASIAYFYRSR